MNQNQIEILIELVKLHQIQEVGGPYFDPVTGGVFSGDLAPFVGLDWQTIETEAIELEKNGYLKLLVRKEDFDQHGLQATNQGVMWYKQYLADQQAAIAAASAQAQAQAQANQTTVNATLDALTLALSDWANIDKDKVLKDLVTLRLLQ